MGLTNLESLPDFVEANSLNYRAYQEGLGDIPGLHMLTYNANEKFLSWVSPDATLCLNHVEHWQTPSSYRPRSAPSFGAAYRNNS
jgi:hypothetical protein